MIRVILCLGWIVGLGLCPLVPCEAAVVTNLNVTGTVNGTFVSATGTILGDSSTGLYAADIQFSTTVADWDLFSLYGTTVSVDRFFSKEVDIGFGVGTNFGTLTGGDFTFNRSVTFGGGLVGTATFAGQMIRTGVGTIDLTGSFVASGNWTPFGTIESVDSYTEKLKSAGAGQATSFMNIPYRMSTGSIVYAETFTTYSFDPLLELLAPQLGKRSILLTANTGNEFALDFEGTVAAIPEPSTMIILGIGLSIGAIGRRWRGRKA